MNELVVTCPDESATVKVAEKIAGHLSGGELIELIGDVGSGKTTFVGGLARGLGSKDKVSSPSFALKNEYQGRLTLYHFDLYRLEKPGLINYEVEDALAENNSAVVIEWGQMVKDILPEDRIIVRFSSTGENSRRLKITYPDD